MMRGFVPGCVLFGEFFLVRPGVQRDRRVRDGWLLGGLWWSTAVMQRGCETQAFTPGFSRPYFRVFCVLPLVGAGWPLSSWFRCSLFWLIHVASSCWSCFVRAVRLWLRLRTGSPNYLLVSLFCVTDNIMKALCGATLDGTICVRSRLSTHSYVYFRNPSSFGCFISANLVKLKSALQL